MDEQIEIGHKVLIQGEFIKDVAKEYRISVSHVSSIVKNIKDDPDHLRKNMRKREEKEDSKQAVKRTVNLMHGQHMMVESILQVARLTEELTEHKVKQSVVR